MPEWESWGSYFKEYLGFEPLAMRRTRFNQQQCMTVPTQWPEWFDSNYKAGDGGHYIAPQRPERPRKTNFAHVFVGSNLPKYQVMIEKANHPDTDKREYRFDENRDGIWVVRQWLGV